MFVDRDLIRIEIFEEMLSAFLFSSVSFLRPDYFWHLIIPALDVCADKSEYPVKWRDEHPSDIVCRI